MPTWANPLIATGVCVAVAAFTIRLWVWTYTISVVAAGVLLFAALHMVAPH